MSYLSIKNVLVHENIYPKKITTQIDLNIFKSHWSLINAFINIQNCVMHKHYKILRNGPQKTNFTVITVCHLKIFTDTILDEGYICIVCNRRKGGTKYVQFNKKNLLEIWNF